MPVALQRGQCPGLCPWGTLPGSSRALTLHRHLLPALSSPFASLTLYFLSQSLLTMARGTGS